MTKEQFDKLYVGRGAVHCDTEDKAKEFLAMAHRFGYKWCSGCSYLSATNWGEYKERTCYKLAFGLYTDKKFLNDYPIVTYPAHTKQFTKADLESGFKLVRRDGEVRYVSMVLNRLYDIGGNWWSLLSNYSEKLEYGGYRSGDIIKVFDRNNKLVYERIEKPVKTPQQLKIERIEGEMRKLADELREIKGE